LTSINPVPAIWAENDRRRHGLRRDAVSSWSRVLESWGFARALHVLAVVLWIGGVAMVTTVLLPTVRSLRSEEALAAFERLEHRFAAQARWTTLLAGASGFYLAYAMDLWWRFAELRYWWMHAMVLVWLVFTLMLFVLEPFVLHRKLARDGARDPAATLRRTAWLHALLLALSVATIAGAVAGSHGVLLFS
jgi:uncharacterized membrane protein